MKTNLVLLLLFSVVSFRCFCQGNYAEEPDYLQKSNQQKTVSYIFGISGGILFGTGFIMYASGTGKGYASNANSSAKNIKNGETLMYAGGGLLVIAIPFQIASNNNRKRAMSIGLSDQHLPYLRQNVVVSNFTPSISLKIGL